MTQLPPWQPIPSFPYEIGGFQFSNGKTWPRIFARRLETNRSGKASLFNPGKNGNYAIGGAKASTGLTDPTSADSQVMWYLADFSQPVDDETLFVLQFGGNDVRAALESAAMGGNPWAVLDLAVNNEIKLIKKLYNERNARNFLVANSPDVGLAPALKLIGAAENASFFAKYYNGLLEAMLHKLEHNQEYKSVSIKRLNFYEILNDVVSNPGAFGIRNTTDSCLVFFTDDKCKRQNKYVFWDGLHPTRKVHRIVGRAAAELYDD
jgi:phospholipase/lecithinase/hemolysin